MQRKRDMGKNIVKRTSADQMSQNSEENGLFLNKSYGIFLLGANVSLYENKIHYVEKYEGPPCEWYCYYSDVNGKEIELWCEEDNIITDICCRISCIYKGHELIHMAYEDFLNLINETPHRHEICYVPINKDRGQNQHVYDFDKSGLQIWVWRNKIRTVIISTYEDDE